jgi:hypothetical protein
MGKRCVQWKEGVLEANWCAFVIGIDNVCCCGNQCQIQLIGNFWCAGASLLTWTHVVMIFQVVSLGITGMWWQIRESQSSHESWWSWEGIVGGLLMLQQLSFWGFVLWCYLFNSHCCFLQWGELSDGCSRETCVVEIFTFMVLLLLLKAMGVSVRVM